ncbi:hypothetical protein M885DRAFT_614806 [Pelagophyceae sp. CCMP2097]|nr:hypothetical protein M885DRAFT_614806 [Pelagophyceae sp. CCMP2097]
MAASVRDLVVRLDEKLPLALQLNKGLFVATVVAWALFAWNVFNYASAAARHEVMPFGLPPTAWATRRLRGAA